MRQQFRDNLVAITSLVVALSALGYNTWRNEVTERNRNVRVGDARAALTRRAARA